MKRSTEDRYRLLLLAYPAEYRRERGEELLAVALEMADAEGRQRPSPADRLDLVRHGLARRARGWRMAGNSPAIGDALAAVAAVLPMLLAARLARGIQVGHSMLTANGSDRQAAHLWVEPMFHPYLASAVWLLVAIALSAGLIRVAKLLAPLAVVAQVVALTSAPSIGRETELLWFGAGLVATALLTTPGLAHRGVLVIGRPLMAGLTGGIAVVMLAAQLLIPGRGMGNGLMPWVSAVVVAIAVTRAMARRGDTVIAAGPLVGLYVLVVGFGAQWVSAYSAGAPVELAVWGLWCSAVVLVPLATVVHRQRLRHAWDAVREPSR